jgi:ribonuclease P/MRP protein subunit RPP1
MLLEARKLGYAGICASSHQEFFRGQEKLPEGVIRGAEIIAANANELRRGIDRFRGRVVVLAVHGGDEAINRAACEDGRIDVLSHPQEGSKSGGINHIIARLAADHRVAIEFSLFPVIHNRGGSRVRVLSAYRSTFALVRKYGAPYVITSGAMSSYDLRDVRSAVAIQIFMNESDAQGYPTIPQASPAQPARLRRGGEVLEDTRSVDVH